jgi:hypothetical protein
MSLHSLVMNLNVPQKAGDFMTNCATISFLKMIFLNRVNESVNEFG